LWALRLRCINLRNLAFAQQFFPGVTMPRDALRRLALATFLSFAALSAGPVAAQSSAVPRPAQLEPDVQFWQRIYSQVTTQGGLLHDDRFLDVVYEELRFPPGLAPAERSDRVDAAREKYQRILKRLAESRDDLSDEERRVLALWPKDVTGAQLADAAERVRFQLGQADRFREGLVRSGAWEHHVEETMRRQGLPAELAALPHVESSFNPRAYSKVGAAGMWQFMPSTGRRWLRVDNVVDERLDPYKSTVAAAQYLQLNYSILGTWPLALTAYNHGAGGMRRAKELMGTDDIVTIVRNYQSRTFGFASRNFYVSFLAAVEIDRNYRKYFGPVERHPRDDSRPFRMPDYVPIAALERVFATDRDTLKSLNLALMDPVLRGERFVPRGFELRVPRELGDPQPRLAKLGDDERFDAQKRDAVHRVRRGESLSQIARRHGTTTKQLMALNGLKSPKSIRSGMTLRLPGTVPAPPASRPVVPAEPAGADVYVVKSGDSLSDIAKRVGLGEKELMELNRIRNPNFIFEGQRLRVSKSAPTAVVAAANAPAAAEALAADDEPEEDVKGATETVRSKPQPVSKEQAVAAGPALMPGVQSAALADPIDYSVQNGTTVVQGNETLGHFADWLQVPPNRLRELNGMKPGTALALGRRIRLDLSKVSAEDFEERRVAWHRRLQDEFFDQYRITAQERYRIRSGESLWQLTQRTNVPVWLLRQYNPEIDFANWRMGTEIVLPRVEAVGPPARTGKTEAATGGSRA
jgi:membrane-bound lytic murein transglycosylase D